MPGMRRLAAALLGSFVIFAAPSAQQPALPTAVPSFDLDEVTIAELQRRMESGQENARSLVQKYLARIDAIDTRGPALRSVLEVNPDALTIADGLDAERKTRGPRGPLHGIPVLIKGNIATADRMQTTAGSLALAGARPPKDAFVVQRLREAGAVILGKTNLSEWANFRSTHSTSGWSGRGGLTKNPYALDRNPSGSSSGSAVAVAGSRESSPASAPSRTAASATVRAIGPAVSWLCAIGTIPVRLTRPSVGLMPTTELLLEGETIDPSVSVPTATTQ